MKVSGMAVLVLKNGGNRSWHMSLEPAQRAYAKVHLYLLYRALGTFMDGMPLCQVRCIGNTKL